MKSLYMTGMSLLLLSCSTAPSAQILAIKILGENFIAKNGFTDKAAGKKISLNWVESFKYCTENSCNHEKILADRHDTIMPFAVGYDIHTTDESVDEEKRITLYFKLQEAEFSGFKCITLNMKGDEIYSPHSLCHGRGMKKFRTNAKKLNQND